MATLVWGQPALKIEFIPSLGLDVLATMGVMCLVHEFEGLSDWVIEAAASLPPRLRQDLQLCMRVAKYPYLVVEALAGPIFPALDSPAHNDFNALIDGLLRLTPADCRIMLISIFEHAAERSELLLERPVAEIANDQEQLEALVRQVGGPLDPAQVVHFFQEPEEWHHLLISTIRRFWERVYVTIHEDVQAQRERNVQYHRSHTYSKHFPELFTSVTGRMYPERLPAGMEPIREVRFVPATYLGPYLAFLFNDTILTVFYNSSVTLTEGNEQMVRAQSLYQPLAALADKTRLQIMALLAGRELYAQEIVNLLEIHQSAVSRHLKLMETAGVLVVRRDRGAKFYSINQQRLEQISGLLRELAT